MLPLGNTGLGFSLMNLLHVYVVVRVENSRLYFIFYFLSHLYFLFYLFSILDLRLEVSMVSHMTVINCHTIMCHMKHYRRS